MSVTEGEKVAVMYAVKVVLAEGHLSLSQLRRQLPRQREARGGATEQYKYCGISCRLETIFAKGIPRNQRSGIGANV